MQTIYWICFIGGGVFVFLSTIGGLDGSEIEFDADVEVGIDNDTELFAPKDDEDLQVIEKRHHWRYNPFLLLATVKFWTFGLCFFGLTGVLLTTFQVQRNSASVFIISLLMGIFIGTMVSLVLRALRQRSPSGMSSPDELIGHLATVEIPLDLNSRGKVRVQFRDGNRELIARTNEEQPLNLGDMVMIIGVEENQVWVVSEKSLHADS